MRNKRDAQRIEVAFSDIHRRLKAAKGEAESAADCFGEGSPQYEIATKVEYFLSGMLYDFTKKYYNGRIPKDGDNCEQTDIRDLFNWVRRIRRNKTFSEYMNEINLHI